MGGAGEALRPCLRDQEGGSRFVPERVVAAGFTYRLLIATTDHLGPTARRTLDGQEKPVGTLLRSDLAALELAVATLAGGVCVPRGRSRRGRVRISAVP